jgi:hypothetical protein
VLLTAAVVPGPPALVPELMGSAAGELDDLRDACDQAIDDVLSRLVPVSTSAQLVVVGAGPPGEFDAAGPVSFASFGRDVTVPPLAADHDGQRELPTPIMVARYLASRDVSAHPEHAALWNAARWVTTSGPDAKALGERLGGPDARVGLILMADGAACHGPKAPRAQDARAEPYDEMVCAALASGQPAQLGQVDQGLGDELGATGAALWPVLVAAAGTAGTELPPENPYIAEVLWTGAPYGVGWTVASWRRPCR